MSEAHLRDIHSSSEVYTHFSWNYIQQKEKMKSKKRLHWGSITI